MNDVSSRSRGRALARIATATSLVCLSTVVTAQAGTPVQITQCGQTVYGDAFLAGDLDCSAELNDVSAVGIEARGTLALNGFTITAQATAQAAVRCTASCTIEGPGTIAGGATGLYGYGLKRATLKDVTVRDATGWCVQSGKLKIVYSTLTSCGYGGVETDRLYMFGADVLDNAGYGVDVDGRRAVVLGTTITGHGIVGLDVSHGRLKLRYATITDNGSDPDCNSSLVCADIAAADLRYEAVICDHSLATETCQCEPDTPFGDANDPLGSNWGLCEFD